ncbi:D-2-hydroxyacid dehydrogenase [Streptomyces sp. NBC_01304]|uniref:D-2-hydroxyacid dehydrogenase n=1 Tax=Streptomyces sp. NBC_01304 TaxID=2903818 RepID=UPI002E158B30|nr:D-2-hydroxyacid dehydrogenase [Streptomyces sp. NBC_01304]
MDELVVGICYPPKWDVRPAEAVAADLAAVRALDPRVRLVDCRYVESDTLRAARGTPPLHDDLRSLAPELTAEQRALFAEAKVVLTADLPFDVRGLAPRLRWVQGIGAGIGHLLTAGLEGVRLTTAAGINGASVAEFALARLLEHAKRLREMDEVQRARDARRPFGEQLAGRTLGVIGLGHIGSRLARFGKALDMGVVAMRRDPSLPRPSYVDEVFARDRLKDFLGACDAVLAAAPETPQTANLMDADAFAAMRPGAFFCNVGRGSLVDEDALIEALRGGRLAGAALDVTRVEPLPADSPLFEAPNLCLSPHVATAAGEHFTGVFTLFRDNLSRYLDGRPLVNEVDPGRGY